jgi:two-component system response regulator LytT
MTAIILDNNEADAHTLCTSIKKMNHDIQIINQFYDLKMFTEFFNKNSIQVDVIFTDIYFGNVNIFEKIDMTKLTKNIIITTQNKDFAPKAFRLNAIDFLLKPIQINHLLESIQKAKKMMTFVDEHKFFKYKSHFQVSMGKQIINIKIEEIDYIESSNKMTYIHLICGKRIPTTKPLIELEIMLDPKIFFRANRQLILHFDSIQTIEKMKSSKHLVKLKSREDKKFVLSEEKSKAFRKWMDR